MSILPKIERFSAHTSTVAFIQEFIRQWYWKRYLLGSKPKAFEHSCCMDPQFILLAAACQDAASLGQGFPYLTVRIDFWHSVNAKTCTLIIIQKLRFLKGYFFWYICKQIFLVLAAVFFVPEINNKVTKKKKQHLITWIRLHER